MPAFLRRANTLQLLTAPAERAQAMRDLYLTDEFPVRQIWPDLHVAEHKGLAMLRNRTAAEPVDWVEIIVDYGKFGGRFHGHPAKLATIPALNGQITSADYGDQERGEPVNAWYKGSYAHNVVVVDGRHQFACGAPVQVGELREAADHGTVQWVDAESHRLYEGVTMQRTVFATEFGVVDLTHCRAEAPRTYDWMFHSYGIAAAGVPIESVSWTPGGDLRWGKDFRSTVSGDPLQVTWTDSPLAKPPHKGATALLHEPAHVRVWALPVPDTELVLFAGPTVEAIVKEREIDYVMLRRTAAATVFATVQEPWRDSTGPRIAAVRGRAVVADGRPLPITDACALEIEGTNGKTACFLVNYAGADAELGPVTTDASVACWSVGPDGTVTDVRHSKGATFSSK